MHVESTYLNCLALFGVGGAHPGGLNLTRRILSREKMDASTKVLDVGCGTGQTSAFISKQYQCHVTALDYNKIMLEKAKKRFHSMNLQIETQYGTAENLPFGNDTFDFILSESVTAFTDVSKSVPEYKRVLKPDGVLLAIEMMRETDVSEKQMKEILDFYGVKQLLNEQEWRTNFEKAGFEQIEVEKVELRPDIHKVDVSNDYSLSKQIDPSFYKIFEKHHHLSILYKDILGCGIFRCSV
nr:class I SAM-dependent methyltransferase [Siminovitchia terrae]